MSRRGLEENDFDGEVDNRKPHTARAAPILPSIPHATSSHKITSATSYPRKGSSSETRANEHAYKPIYMRASTPPNSSLKDPYRQKSPFIARSAKPAFVGEVYDYESLLEQIRQLKISNVHLREERTQLQTKIFRLESDAKKHSKKQKKAEKADSAIEKNPSINSESSNVSASRQSPNDALVVVTSVSLSENMCLQSKIDEESPSLQVPTPPTVQVVQEPVVNIPLVVPEIGKRPIPQATIVIEDAKDQTGLVSLDSLVAEIKEKISKLRDFLQEQVDPRRDTILPILSEFEAQIDSGFKVGRRESMSVPRRPSIVPITSQISKVFRESNTEPGSPIIERSKSPVKPMDLLKPKLSSSLFFSSSPNLMLPQAKRSMETSSIPENSAISAPLEKNPSVLEGISVMDATLEEFTDWWSEQDRDNHFLIVQELFYMIKDSSKVFELTTQITFSRTVEEAVQKFKDGCVDVLGADRALLYMSQGERKMRVFLEDNEDQFPVIEIGSGIFGKAVASGEAAIVNRIDTHSHYLPEFDKIPGYELKNVLVIPLADRTGQIYAVALSINKTQGMFQDEDEVLMQALVDTLSNCLQQFKLLERTQRAQQRNKAISEVLKAVHNEAYTVDDVINRIIEVTYEVIVVDRVSLFLVDNIAKELLLKVSKDQVTIRIPLGVGIAGLVAKTGETINIRDAYKDPRFDQEFDTKTGYTTKTILCLPIFDSNKRPVAVIQLINKASGYFTKDDEDLMTTFTAEAASALQRKSIETAYQNLTTNSAESKRMQQIKGLLDEYITRRESRSVSIGSALRMLKAMPSMATIQGLKDWNLDHFSLSDSQMVNFIVSGFQILGLMDQFKIERHTLVRFTEVVQSNYNKNPYHNFVHAFSVFHCCFMILTTTELSQYLTPNDILALMVAALVHDLDHPGTNNAFMINSQAELAILYNDVSVLENHHSALAFQILQKPEVDIFRSLTRADRMEIRKTMIPAILSTDMSEHAKMTTSLSLHSNEFDRNVKEDRQFLVNIVLHSSDLCNPVLPRERSYSWATKVLEEFNNQAKKEKELSLPVAGFMEKSDEVSKANLNIGFIKYVVSPLWTRLSEILPGLDECVQRMNQNLQSWEQIANSVPKEA